MTVSIIICVLLHKLGCIRQFENKISLRSLALTLHKLGCIRQFENKISLRSLALTLHKLGCIRQFENKISTANACQNKKELNIAHNIRYTANGHTHYYILG